MKGGTSPKISKVDTGKTLVEQGDHGHELFLLHVAENECRGEVEDTADDQDLGSCAHRVLP
jgi:hypothetical protein